MSAFSATWKLSQGQRISPNCIQFGAFTHSESPALVSLNQSVGFPLIAQLSIAPKTFRTDHSIEDGVLITAHFHDTVSESAESITFSVEQDGMMVLAPLNSVHLVE
jgi:hypothetical protein